MPPPINDNNANNEVTLSGYIDESRRNSTAISSIDKNSNTSTANLIADDLSTVCTEVDVKDTLDSKEEEFDKLKDSPYSIGDSVWFVVGALTMADVIDVNEIKQNSKFNCLVFHQVVEIRRVAWRGEC
ncbi:hypothetical protein ElyMa_006591100 [Elysia marginata]|uniref:Uncharacterized protein n=1 Tax=Elysia marginata TaxID=1093978 RepID=A0AAV4IF26_9GAST|nr:hypothetical protein ElyMa_006591100 [Elysia marginata]